MKYLVIEAAILTDVLDAPQTQMPTQRLFCDLLMLQLQALI